MSNPIYNLAFDFGASSGRMILSKTEDGKITLEELHRLQTIRFVLAKYSTGIHFVYSMN